MSVNSFEVGAIFTIKDQSTTVLREMAVQMERIEGLTKSATAALTEFGKGVRIGGLVTRMNDLGESMTVVAAKSAELKSSFASDFESINAGLFNTVQLARELSAAMTEIGAAGMAMSRNVAAGAGAARGGGGHGGGGFMGGVSKGAGMGSVLSHPATFVAGFAAFEAMEKAASLEDTVDRAMVAMNIPVDSNYMKTDVAKNIRSQIQATSKGWGMPLEQAEESSLQAIRSLAPLSKEDRLKLLPSILDFAGAETFSKHGTTPEEATEAGVGLAHQLRLYTPEKIEPIFGALTQLSMASPQSLSQISRMSSYFLPLLTAGLDMDPAKLMAMGVVGGQMGLNTKSGTWLARMFEAPFTHDLTGKRQNERRQALEELGLITVKRDHFGHIVGTDAVTKDPFEFVKILSEHMKAIPEKKRLSDLSAAFGEQGSKAATIWTDPAVLKNLEGLFENLKNAPSVAQIRQAAMESPLKKVQQNEQEFVNLLADMGTTVLPAVNFGLSGVNYLLKGIAEDFRSTFSLIGGWASDIWHWASSKGPTNEQKMADAQAAVDAEAKRRKDNPVPPLDPRIMNAIKNQNSYDPLLPHPMSYTTSGKQGGQVINISDVHIHGVASDDPDSLAEKMFNSLARKLATAQTHNLGSGDGVYSSPYTSGGGVQI